MKTLQEQRTESVLNMQERITELEKENAELKKKCYKKAVKDYCELEKENAELIRLVNQYKASKCSSISLVNRNMIMFDQLTKAKELLAKWVKLCKPKLEGYPIPPIQEQTEQFLKECK